MYYVTAVQLNGNKNFWQFFKMMHSHPWLFYLEIIIFIIFLIVLSLGKERYKKSRLGKNRDYEPKTKINSK